VPVCDNRISTQQTIEARAYGLARKFSPLLVNSVVGFIGPEYLNVREIIRTGIEDHFCGKLLGLPMGIDVCYTNHADADQDDMDTLLTLLGAAGVNYIMGVPGADDIMLNYQSTSFHDALYLRQLLHLKPAPEFENWLIGKGIFADGTTLKPATNHHSLLALIEPESGPCDAVAELTRKSEIAPPDPWQALSKFTAARIGLGRAGGSLPTRPLLEFQLAHARACDAVWRDLDMPDLARTIAALGLDILQLHSAARDRAPFIARPDLGRVLDSESRASLERQPANASPYDCLFVVADGLSAQAVESHALPLLTQLMARLRDGWNPAPLAIVQQGRVAIGDEIGALLQARMTVLLIGERPGLSSADSLGVYLTHDPRPEHTNAERNCISNMREPGGLSHAGGAHKLFHLMTESRRRGLSGILLKENAPQLIRA
jgi:ethanolamine ammonia-lyase small subunit